MKVLFRKRKSRVERVFAVGFLAVFSFLVGRFAWTHSTPRPTHGFLMKNGNEFVVAWKSGNLPVEISSYGTLEKALGFVHDDLGLKSGFNPATGMSVEHSWLRASNGTYMLFWKNWNSTQLNRITFSNERDARFFFEAFRSGAYSGSPIGHAIALVPIRLN